MSAKTGNPVVSDNGFTLIELLVVIAIIGILAAIAVPQFAAYKQAANDAEVTSTLRSLAVSMEAYYVNNDSYAAATIGGGGVNDVTVNFGYVMATDSTDANIVVFGGGPGCPVNIISCWSATATNAVDGTGTPYIWDSSLGGAQW